MSQKEQATQLPFQQSHAFIIGINDYEHITPLKTAVNDALGIAQRLEEQHAYTVHPPLLNAKKAAILEWLTETIPQAVGPEDRVVFYFAGHGIALD
ncbi:MAG: caspase family protein, partial [Phaeodactylibacter sp.]|nr:caspase family protein [Phaeodactylibacter sp.]